MKKICVVTATRAEYGILRPLIQRLLNYKEWETQIVVTGTHLEKEFGYTCQEIERDNIPVFARIPIVEKGDDGYAVTRTMANAMVEFGKYFKDEKPDLLIILGDRTEMLAIASAAMNEQIPIAHLHGGELTQGAVDDSVRHALTKMSYLHFASAEEYRRRIIQMGEAPERVFNVGALGVENILREELFSREELKEAADFPAEKDYAVVTFHPVTLEAATAKQQVYELLEAMNQKPELYYLITKANSDAGGREINAIMEQEVAKHSNMKLVSSLGMKRYLSAVKYARLVLGNSSSGIIEVPALGVPTVNIGDRQQGRIMADSIINCEPQAAEIVAAMDKALHRKPEKYNNPYGDGRTSEKIVEILKDFLLKENIDLKKKFYDISWSGI